MMRRGLGMRVAATCAIVLAGAAAAAWWIGSRGRAPGPVETGDNVATSVADAGDSAPAPAVERGAVEGRACIEGVVLDAAGQPLSGWTVEMRSAAAAFDINPGDTWDSWSAHPTTDEEGRFHAESVPPGEYRVGVQGDERSERTVSVAAGARERVELRVWDGACVLTLKLIANGRPSHGCYVSLFTPGGVECPVERRGDDEFQFLASSGLHRVVVRLWVGDKRPKGETLQSSFERYADMAATPSNAVLHESHINVPNGVARWRTDLHFVQPMIVAAVVDGFTDAIQPLTFSIVGEGAIGGEKLTLECKSHDGRRGFEVVPPGRWTVSVDSPRLLPVEPQTIDVAVGQQRARVEFTAQRCGIVRLDLRKLGGGAFSLPLRTERWLPMLSARSDRSGDAPCIDVGPLLQLRDGGTVPGLGRVPLGPATLSWVDREVDGETVFLAFDPPPPLALDVVADDRNVALLFVEPRAFVTLVACERGGLQAPGATIRVLQGEWPVRPLHPSPRDGPIVSGRRSRWEACLPPGSYRAIIEYPDKEVREHHIVVERTHLTLRLRR